jgi:bifunctional UDP-N-acetylglucosamine pyrophosphorylase/glucosamine-1-phosphate N-acetyltransferase
MTSPGSSPVAVILAAGLGTRMKSALPKVLHPVLGRPMVGWVVEALRGAGVERIILVVHHGEELVRAAFPGLEFARQEAPRGTGDALRSALPLLPMSGPVIVAAGDTPLVGAAVVRRLLDEHHGDATVGSFEVEDPRGYGRILREGGTHIVEETDCTPTERLVREVNSGMYVFDAAYLRALLPELRPHPPKGELYLTDLVGPRAVVVSGFEATDFAGVNDRAALADARTVLRDRVNRAWARAGVDFEDLDTAYVDATVRLHADARIGPGVVLQGACDVAGEVGAHCVLVDTVVEAGARVLAGSVCEGAVVRAGAAVGPIARLRAGAVIGERARIGNFVEVKNTVLGAGAKANHLAYLGDAEVGAAANIGAGTITCNYDGVRKNRTFIGARAFIGSNSSLVAPIRIGEGAIVGAGSAITQDVPDDAIAVVRGALKVHERSAERLRSRYRALAAAKATS